MSIKSFLSKNKSFILVFFMQFLSLCFSISSYKNSRNRIQIIETIQEEKKFNICANSEDGYKNSMNLNSCSLYCREETGNMHSYEYRNCFNKCCNKPQ